MYIDRLSIVDYRSGTLEGFLYRIVGYLVIFYL